MRAPPGRACQACAAGQLEVRDPTCTTARSNPLKGISFRVGQGEIGPCSATTARARPPPPHALRHAAGRTGDVRQDGALAAAVPSHQVVRLGITHVPEGRATSTASRDRQPGDGRLHRADREVTADMERVFAIFRAQGAPDTGRGHLSGGEQKMLAIGRALMPASPPAPGRAAMGLAQVMVEQIFETVETINRQGVTILLVEQNAAMARPWRPGLRAGDGRESCWRGPPARSRRIPRPPRLPRSRSRAPGPREGPAQIRIDLGRTRDHSST